MARKAMFFAALLLITSAAAWPQDDYSRLARVSYVEGDVSFQNASDDDWSAASVNLPLVPGDRIYTGPKGKGEIEFDDGSILRLAENTDVEFVSLEEDLVQLRILLGLSTLKVSGGTDFEINTPAAAFNPVRPGVYRFDVVEDGDTDVIVHEGEIEAANDNFERRLRPDQRLQVGPGGSPVVSDYRTRDLWDEWNDRRDADRRAYANSTHVPDTVYVGVSDLNRHGRWVTVENYGTAWVPYHVAASWSPYSVGRWCYRPVFGWTWISYEPWGWLPYHYGRWYRSSVFGWCWLPGPAFSFSFWSPGLVSFYSGPGWVSWRPLGPGDYYDVAHYHYNRRRHHHHIVELRRIYHRSPDRHFYRDVRDVYRTVRVEHFRDGHFRDFERASRWHKVDKPWKDGSLVRGRIDVKPTKVSYSAAPDRKGIRPAHRKTLPSVVRHVPKKHANDRDRFTRINNPRITSSRPRMWSNDDRDKKDNTGQVRQAGSRWENRSSEGQNRNRVERPDQPRNERQRETRQAGSRWENNSSDGQNRNRVERPDPPRNEREKATGKPEGRRQNDSPDRQNRNRVERSNPPQNAREKEIRRPESRRQNSTPDRQNRNRVERPNLTRNEGERVTRNLGSLRQNRTSSRPNAETVRRNPASESTRVERQATSRGQTVQRQQSNSRWGSSSGSGRSRAPSASSPRSQGNNSSSANRGRR